MELKELKKKTGKELQSILAESRDKLRDLRFKDANKQLKNVREIRITRTLISRVLTLLNAGHDNAAATDKAAPAASNNNKEQ